MLDNYFDHNENQDALRFSLSMTDFMKTVSLGYLGKIGAKNFDYIEYHEDGSVLNLTNNMSLIFERFQRKMKYQILFSEIIFSMELYQPKIFLWPDQPNNKTLETLYQMNVWNGCNVFIRGEKKISVFSFSGDKNSYNLRSNCNNNQKDLFLFIHNFSLIIKDRLGKSKPKYISTDIKFESKRVTSLRSLELDKGVVLTRKELEVAKYLSRGYSANYISDKCFLSPRTIETHIKNIKGKIYDQRRENLSKQGLIDFLYQKQWLLESVI